MSEVQYTAEEAAYVADLKAKPFPALANDCYIRAAKGLPTPHVPVWLHRQAGRYLPEFQAVRAKHGFFEVCRTPSLACEVTVQPIDRYPALDCSIIFSDILVVPQALGLEVVMKDGSGPHFPAPLRTLDDLARLDTSVDVDKALGYVYDAIIATRHGLGGRVPLIGFCGGPWTLFAYMTDGGGSKTFQHSKTWLYTHPAEAHKVLQTITDVCVGFLVGQAKAGAQGLQVFESNAGELSPEMFKEFALPYLAQIPARVKAALREAGVRCSITSKAAQDASAPALADDDVPITCFPRNAGYALPWLAATQYDTYSLDWTVLPCVARAAVAKPVVVEENKKWLKAGIDAETGAIDAARMPSVTLQGSLDPGALFAPAPALQAATATMLKKFGRTGYIANLGHGMLPMHPTEGVRVFTEAVHAASAQMDAEAAAAGKADA